MAGEKLKLTIELTMAELQKALLPNGGKITEVEISSPPPRKRSRAKNTPSTTPKDSSGKKK